MPPIAPRAALGAIAVSCAVILAGCGGGAQSGPASTGDARIRAVAAPVSTIDGATTARLQARLATELRAAALGELPASRRNQAAPIVGNVAAGVAASIMAEAGQSPESVDEMLRRLETEEKDRIDEILRETRERLGPTDPVPAGRNDPRDKFFR